MACFVLPRAIGRPWKTKTALQGLPSVTNTWWWARNMAKEEQMDETALEMPTGVHFGRGSKNFREALKHNSPQLDILAGFDGVYRFGEGAFKGFMVPFFFYDQNVQDNTFILHFGLFSFSSTRNQPPEGRQYRIDRDKGGTPASTPVTPPTSFPFWVPVQFN